MCVLECLVFSKIIHTLLFVSSNIHYINNYLPLSDWQPVHSERHLVKVVGGVAGRSDSEHYHLPHDIDSHAFTKFTNIYFKVSLLRFVPNKYENLSDLITRFSCKLIYRFWQIYLTYCSL